MDFHPTSNDHLAYPLDKTVLILGTADWSEKFNLSCYSVDAPFSIVQFSPCGKFLAAASQDGSITVWNMINQTLVGVNQHPSSVAVCAMVWNPTGATLIQSKFC